MKGTGEFSSKTGTEDDKDGQQGQTVDPATLQTEWIGEFQLFTDW